MNTFKARVVALIVDGKPEKALALLANHHRVSVPSLRVGVVKGRSRGVCAVYVPSKETILVAKGDYLFHAPTILHEFYHHLRHFGGEHRGTERHAEEFANSFLEAYRKLAASQKT